MIFYSITLAKVLQIVVKSRTEPFIKQMTKYNTTIDNFFFLIEEERAKTFIFKIRWFLFTKNGEEIVEACLSLNKYLPPK